VSQPDIEARPDKARVPCPSEEELNWVALGAPPMLGAEYLTPAILLGRPRRPPVSGVRLGCSGE